jgi:hypothetical protein
METMCWLKAQYPWLLQEMIYVAHRLTEVFKTDFVVEIVFVILYSYKSVFSAIFGQKERIWENQLTLTVIIIKRLYHLTQILKTDYINMII